MTWVAYVIPKQSLIAQTEQEVIGVDRFAPEVSWRFARAGMNAAPEFCSGFLLHVESA